MKLIFKGYLLTFLMCNMTNTHENYEKWFVITTINNPTAIFKKLTQFKDWHGVVVADKKTPQDWNVPGVTFLSVEYQQNCKYKIAKILPWNHYSRKNIGYLYAIEHGAKIIYETDDDNFLIDDDINYLPEHTDCMQYRNENDFLFNPYSYFSQPTTWPRGFPLKAIHKNNTGKMFFESKCFIPVQQGLVNKDPDVDAIFRLTRQEIINFDGNVLPIAVDKGIMAPFNSQNTFFYHSAFWALLMPMTTTFRVADIWRGYWVQRLLWDINGNLCFLPPNAFQERNEHDLLKDFEQEIDLYLRVDSLLQLLNNWRSNKSNLYERMMELFIVLVNNNFLAIDDLYLLEAWIEDLKNIGYIPPSITS